MNINHKAVRHISSVQDQYAGQPVMTSTLVWVMKLWCEMLEYKYCSLGNSQSFGTLSQPSSYLGDVAG